MNNLEIPFTSNAISKKTNTMNDKEFLSSALQLVEICMIKEQEKRI